MEDRKLDTMIEETLEQQASRISMSPERQRKIKQSVRNNKIKEESSCLLYTSDAADEL